MGNMGVGTAFVGLVVVGWEVGVIIEKLAEGYSVGTE